MSRSRKGPWDSEIVWAKPLGHWLYLYGTESFCVTGGAWKIEDIWKCNNCGKTWKVEHNGHIPLVGVPCKKPNLSYLTMNGHFETDSKQKFRMGGSNTPMEMRPTGLPFKKT